MKTAERSLPNRSLSEAAIETIDVLYQHRLLTTSQLREMLLPGRSLRRTQQVLAELVRRQLADWVAARGSWPGPAERVWFLTKRGGAVVDAVPNKAEPRLRLVSPEQASGRRQPHTLAVNEIGIAFMRAARQCRDDFNIRSWRHEIAHDIAIGRRRRLVIADAVLKYWAFSPEDRMVLSYRFLELERATLPIEDLFSKLKRYVDLWRCWKDYWQAGDWERSPACPPGRLATAPCPSCWWCSPIRTGQIPSSACGLSWACVGATTRSCTTRPGFTLRSSMSWSPRDPSLRSFGDWTASAWSTGWASRWA